MFRMMYQGRTYLEMKPMGRKEWTECLRSAEPVVAAIRRELEAYAVTGDKAHKEKADRLKRTLPGVCFQASDVEESVSQTQRNKGQRGRWRAQTHTYLSGLAVIDVDHCGDPHERFARIQAEHDLRQLGILLVYVSASGEGLKIVFKARQEWGNLICNQYEMAQQLGILDFVDDACKDSSRLSFLTGAADMLYADEAQLFDGEEELFPALDETRTAYDLQYGERYRQAPRGDSSPTVQRWAEFEQQRRKAKRKGGTGRTATRTQPVATQSPQTGRTTQTEPQQEPQQAEAQTEAQTGQTQPSPQTQTQPSPQTSPAALTEREQAIVEALNGYYGESLPEGTRHSTFCQQTAHWLCWLADNNPQRAMAMAAALSYVKEWQPQGGEVEDLVQSAANKKILKHTPKELAAVLEKAGIEAPVQKAATPASDPMADLPFDRWCGQIEALFGEFPCLREVCQPHPRRLWPFLLFASAAMMGTCMTLTYYRFYDHPEKRSRLNYIVLGVGDPTSGKGTLGRLSELLLAPIIDADRMADEATNAWKEMKGNAANNKDTRARDKIYNRMFGPRASNTEFIRSLINNKITVDGEEMNVHLVTVDSEKDNSINMSKSGGWQNRDIMVLKSFHNEVDSQHYSNNQSVSGRFPVHWNQIETCTPSTLTRLVNERNFNTGLDTRMAVIPTGKPDFDMMPLARQDSKLATDDGTLRTWAFRLDQRRGELPIWPLVEYVYKWCDERRAIAEFNQQDQADWLLIKRVPYYGLNVSAPYIDMRHWEEREQTGTYAIDDTDRRLCSLALDIQYRCQLHYFYELHRKYYDDQLREAAQYRRRTNKYVECFRRLPEEFTTEQFAEIFGYANTRSGQKTLERLVDDKAIERTKRGNYKKLVNEL